MKQNNDTPDAYTGDILQNKFTAYVNRALRNNRISYYRKQAKHTRPSTPPVKAIQPPVHIPAKISHADLIDSLQMLTDNELILIRMRVLYGYSYDMISELLEIRPATLRMRYSRAIRKLRKRLEEMQ